VLGPRGRDLRADHVRHAARGVRDTAGDVRAHHDGQSAGLRFSRVVVTFLSLGVPVLLVVLLLLLVLLLSR